MEKLNYNKILDLTLSVLLAETPNSHIEYNLLFKQNPSLNNLVNRDKRAVIEKLLKDEYIGKMDVSNIAPNDYYITVEGILFIDNGKGGYVKEKRLKWQDWVIKKTTFVFLVITTVSTSVYTSMKVAQVLQVNRPNISNTKVLKESIHLKPKQHQEFLKKEP